MKLPLQIDIVYLENYDLEKWGKLQKSKEDDSGFDLRAAPDRFIRLYPGQRTLIPNGIKLSIPKGYEGLVCPRSGLASKFGVTVLNTPGTIDPGYRGEIKTLLINNGTHPFDVDIGMRISQLKIKVVPEVQFIQVSQLPD